MAMNSTSNGPRSRRVPRSTTVIGNLRAPGSWKRRISRRLAGELRRVDRRLQPRPQVHQRADVVLVGMGDDDAEQVRALLLEEAHVRHDQVDAGQVVAREAHAAIDQHPLAFRGGPKP